MIISLVGYMGSGKSFISKILSEKLNFNLIDLDQEISNTEQQNINDIFKNKGELYFRKIEKQKLEDILSIQNNAVLSLGGGTPAYYNNMEIINSKTLSVFLQASVPTIIERLEKEPHSRPLIDKIPKEDLPEFIAKHLFERNPFYHQCQYTLDTNNKSAEEIAEEIITLLNL